MYPQQVSPLKMTGEHVCLRKSCDNMTDHHHIVYKPAKNTTVQITYLTWKTHSGLTSLGLESRDLSEISPQVEVSHMAERGGFQGASGNWEVGK